MNNGVILWVIYCVNEGILFVRYIVRPFRDDEA